MTFATTSSLEMPGTAGLVTRNQTARRFEIAGGAALKQQQHRALAGVEGDQPLAVQHRRRVEEARIERGRARQVVAVERCLEDPPHAQHEIREDTTPATPRARRRSTASRASRPA